MSTKLFDNPNDKDTPGKLPDAVEAIFEPVKCHPGPAIWKGSKIDTTQISVEEAHALVKDGFSFLKYKPGKEPKAEAPAKEEKPK